MALVPDQPSVTTTLPPLLTLPAEIRLEIFDHLLDFSVASLCRSAYDQLARLAEYLPLQLSKPPKKFRHTIKGPCKNCSLHVSRVDAPDSGGKGMLLVNRQLALEHADTMMKHSSIPISITLQNYDLTILQVLPQPMERLRKLVLNIESDKTYSAIIRKEDTKAAAAKEERIDPFARSERRQ